MTVFPPRRGRGLLLLLALLASCAAAPDALHAPSPDSVLVAAVQYQIRGDRTPDQLCAEVERHARAAAAAGARLVVFPELVALDCWPLSTPGEPAAEAAAARAIARDVTPVLVERTAALASELEIAILVGGPRLHQGHVRNTEFLLWPDGRRDQQDKLFLTAWERGVGWQPGDELLLLDAPWGRTAIAVCYDVEFPAVSQALAAHDVEVLLVPSMTESERGLCRVRECAEARAVEHHAFVVVASTVGELTPDWRHFGQSAVLSPQDGPFRGLLTQARAGEPGLVLGGLDLGLLRQSRAASRFFPARDQRERPPAIRVRSGR